MTIPSYVYAFLIGVVIVSAFLLWFLAPLLLSIVWLAFPLLSLLMLWDIMSGLGKIWAKLWEISSRIESQEIPNQVVPR